MNYPEEVDDMTGPSVVAQPRHKLKRTKSGCLIVANPGTPAADKMYGYVLDKAHGHVPQDAS
ncbi:MAG: hypothetical protein QOH68_85 [Nocardioidaceae bacterium]|nr:hypothetical protein [Nocardioidaceae bacterium]